MLLSFFYLLVFYFLFDIVSFKSFILIHYIFEEFCLDPASFLTKTLNMLIEKYDMYINVD